MGRISSDKIKLIMNILVTGANGQLGNEMRLVSEHSHHNFVFTDVNQVEGNVTQYLDITDPAAVRDIIKENDIKVVVNCAAFTNVDAAETNEELAEKLNATAPLILATAIKDAGGLLIHISTDYVFGKEPYNIPCREDQQGTPTGVYGMTKLHGEQNIIGTGCRHVIIRTAWLYSEFGKNFCKTMLNLTSTKPQLKVVFDQVGTPTYALDLANAIMTVIDDYGMETETNGGNKDCAYKKTGIYHFSNEGVCSWFDFTKMIQQIASDLGYYDKCANAAEDKAGTSNAAYCACSVEPCHSNEFPSPVTRPSYSVLDKTKIKQTFGIKVPYWTESLRKCIANITK